MDYLLQKEYNINMHQYKSFNEFSEFFFKLLEQLITNHNINKERNKIIKEKKQIIFVCPSGIDKIKVFNEYILENELNIGKDNIKKQLMKLEYREINEDLLNSFFRLIINYCFINNISFFWEISLLNLDILIYYINLAKKFDFVTNVYVIKKDLVNNYILYYYNIYKQLSEKNIEFNDIDLMIYITENLNISRLINKKEKDIKYPLYIPNEIETVIINYDNNFETKEYIEKIKLKLYDLIKNIRLFESNKILPCKVFQRNLIKLEAAKNSIVNIIDKELFNKILIENDEFIKLYKKESNFRLNIEFNPLDYVFLDSMYKYESVFYLSKDKLRLLLQKYLQLKNKNGNIINNIPLSLSKEQIEAINNFLTSKECPKIFECEIKFANEEEKNYYKVGVNDNRLIFLVDERLVDTNNEYENKFKTKKINEKSKLSCFLIDTNNDLFIFPFQENIMHHSFITKDKILNKLAGMLFIKEGKICFIENLSGHYKTEAKQMDLFFEKLESLLKNKEISQLFHPDFQISLNTFPNNYTEILVNKKYGLNLVNIDEISAKAIRERIKNKFWNNSN